MLLKAAPRRERLSPRAAASHHPGRSTDLSPTKLAMVTSNDAVRRFLQESLATDRQGGKLLKKKLGQHQIESD